MKDTQILGKTIDHKGILQLKFNEQILLGLPDLLSRFYLHIIEEL